MNESFSTGSPAASAGRLGTRRVGVLTAAILLVPYATIALGHRAALVVQAAAILAISLGLLGFGLRLSGWRVLAWKRQPRLAWGLGLYGATALWGGALGLVRGNDPGLVAGQVLSLGLLPLAAVAAGGLFDRAAPVALAYGLGFGVAAASLIHWVVWLAGFPQGGLDPRLFFPNSVSVVGSALLGLLALLVLATHDGRGRRLALVAAVPVALLILVAAVRGLWLASTVALALFLSLELSDRRRRKAVGLLVLCSAVLAAAGMGVGGWVGRDRPNLLPTSRPAALLEAPPSPGRGVAAAPGGALQLSAGAAGCAWALGGPRVSGELQGCFRLQGRLIGGEAQRPYVAVQWLAADGRLLGRLVARRQGSGLARAVAAAPQGARSLRLVVGCTPAGEGTWRLEAIELQRLGPAWVARLTAVGESLHRRFRAGGALLRGDVTAVPSFDLRVRESHRLLELFRGSSWPGRLAGHGLGATFHPASGGGVIGEPTPVHYIHNFYLFLLFKVGLLGAVAVVTALGLWIGVALTAAKQGPHGLRRSLAAATAAGLIAYSLWSVTSPEILDFRVAPLWGMLLGALASRPGHEV